MKRPNTLRRLLIGSGVPDEKVLEVIYARVFPWPARAYRTLRLWLGADPYAAEWGFVGELAACACWADIEQAFHAWRVHPFRNVSWLARCLGGVPDRKRVCRFYLQLRLVPAASPVGAAGQPRDILEPASRS